MDTNVQFNEGQSWNPQPSVVNGGWFTSKSISFLVNRGYARDEERAFLIIGIGALLLIVASVIMFFRTVSSDIEPLPLPPENAMPAELRNQ